MKEGEIINENEIVLPILGGHVVAAGIGGKEKNSMKKEDIEKAAKHIIDEYNLNPEYGSYFEHGFIDGAEWRINSVWHDIKEMPENNRMILVIMQHDIPTVLGPDNSFFREEIKDRHIQRWAYVKDLIPNTEE